MIPYIGDFAEDATIYHYFNTFDSNDPSASVTITNLADTDIYVYKDGSVTDIVTDGASVVIDFDSRTGVHKLTIDTSVHADYAVGSDYMVLIEGTTVDAGTVTAGIFTFSIENRYNDVNVVSVAGTTQTANDNGADINTLVTQVGTAGAGLTDLGGMSTTMKGQVNTEADTAISDFWTSPATLVDLIWDEDVDTSHQTAGTAGKKLDDAGGAADPWATALPGAYGAGTAGEILGDWKNAGRLDAILDELTVNVDAIEADTQDLQTQVGTAGAGLTNLGGSGNDWNTVVPDAAGVAPTVAEITADVWDEATATARTAGTYGQLFKDNIDAAITTAATATGFATEAKQDAQDAIITEARLSELDAATAGKMANQVDIIQTDTTTDIPATITTIDNEIAALQTDLDTLTDARGEPAQGAPAVSTTTNEKVDWLYKAWRNQSTQTATTYSLYNDAADTVDSKATVSDDGTTATKGEVVTGP